MPHKMIVSIAVAVLVYLAPLALVPHRLAHPGPWIGFLVGVTTLATQPPLGLRKMLADRADRYSALAILVGVIGSQLAAMVQFGLRRELTPPPLSLPVFGGIAAAGLGLGLRLWSIKTLGSFFTSTVVVKGSHWIVDRGPYSVLRHPSYSGMLLTSLGVALAVASPVGFLLVGLLVLPAYLHRIRVEEEALLAGLGGVYDAYRRRTWRLLPFVF